MANLAITYPSFVSGTDIFASQVNQNNTDIVTYINNRNTGTSKWDNLKTVAALNIDATSNQIVTSAASSFTGTISVTTPAANRTYTFPDLATNYNVVADAGTQTIGGAKTFSGTMDVTGQLKGKGTSTNDNADAGYVGEYVSGVRSSVANLPATGTWGDIITLSLTAGDWDVTGIGDFTRNTATWTSVSLGISTTSGSSATGLSYGDTAATMGWASSSSTPTEVTLIVPAVRFSLASPTSVYLKYVGSYSVGQPQLIGRISARRVR